MSHTDSSFYKVCGAVMGLLVLFTLFIMFVANSWSPDSQEDPLAVAKRDRQIAPVGRSRVAEVVDNDAASTGEGATATAAVAEPAATSTAEAATKEEVVEEVAVETTEVEATDVAKTTAVASTAAVDIPNNVKAAVDSVCAACHVSGIADAPKYGDAAAWDARMEKGLDAVTASAIAGVGAMPPRGGSSLNDDEIRLAVQYMLTK